MTYGEFLRHCYVLSGSATKKEFAERVGMKDPDHLIGAMNDRPDKAPSLDLLERAAKTAGINFQDYIQVPKQQRKLSRKHAELVRQLLEVLNHGGDPAEYLSGNIRIYHHHVTRRR